MARIGSLRRIIARASTAALSSAAAAAVMALAWLANLIGGFNAVAALFFILMIFAGTWIAAFGMLELTGAADALRRWAKGDGE